MFAVIPSLIFVVALISFLKIWEVGKQLSSIVHSWTQARAATGDKIQVSHVDDKDPVIYSNVSQWLCSRKMNFGARTKNQIQAFLFSI